MATKISKFKDVLRESGNLHLFKDGNNDSELTASISIKNMNIFVLIVLPEGNIHNTVEFMITKFDSYKKRSMQDLVNELNCEYVNSKFLIRDLGETGIWVTKRVAYTALSNDFNPDLFSRIFLGEMEDLEARDLSEIMKIVW